MTVIGARYEDKPSDAICSAPIGIAKAAKAELGGDMAASLEEAGKAGLRAPAAGANRQPSKEQWG